MKSNSRVNDALLGMFLTASLAIPTAIIAGCASKKLPTAVTPLNNHTEAISDAGRTQPPPSGDSGMRFAIPRVSVTGQSVASGGTRPSFSGGRGGGGGGLLTEGLRNTIRTQSISRSSGREELWVIARNSNSATPQDDTPGSGTLMTEVAGQKVPMPLKHTDVNARICAI